MRSRAANDAGFSLPEVTIALGLIASVMISIAGLFIFADRLVDRGREMSAAVTIAENIVEETNSWTYEGLYETFGVDGSLASYTFDTRVDAYASRWQTELDDRLPSSWAEITVDSVSSGGTPPALADAIAIRVGVRVVWDDNTREREVRLATIRM